MILLDTNVISEPQHPTPNAHVLDWIDAQALETLYLSAITVAELRAGIALLPAWRLKRPMPSLQPLPSPTASPLPPVTPPLLRLRG